jgi:lipopolysaccharide/colanic/teichoic acid biosynthesis glycosyltransferase
MVVDRKEPVVKRLFDLFVGTLALIVLSPLMLMACVDNPLQYSSSAP